MLTPDSAINETLVTENTDLILSLTADFSKNSVLLLSYHVRNHSPVPIYLLNQLWKNIKRDIITGQQVFEILPNLANIQVSSEEVNVSKKAVEVPYGKLVEVLYIPCATRLEPDSEYAEEVELPLPLMPYTIYESTHSPGPVTPCKLYFEIGYISSLLIAENTVKKVESTKNTVFYIDNFSIKDQSLIRVGPFQAPVTVIRNPEREASAEAGLRWKQENSNEWSPWS